jgi:hypothetical protein
MVGQGRLLVKNILQSFQNEKSYFISANKFKLKGVRVGPLPKDKKITLKICNFINNNFKIKDDELLENDNNLDTDNNTSYYELFFEPELTIHSDIKITFQGVVSFYVWVNLWYSSWENIKKFYDKAELNEEEKNYIHQELEEMRNQQGIKEKEMNNNNTCKPKYNFDIYETVSNNTRQINNLNFCIINDKLTVDDNKKEDCSGIRINERNTERDKIEKITSSKSLYEIIYKLKHNTDLNELITRINMDLDNKFDKKDMEIVLNSFEFDKFDEVNKYPDLKTTIYYSLVEK